MARPLAGHGGAAAVPAEGDGDLVALRDGGVPGATRHAGALVRLPAQLLLVQSVGVHPAPAPALLHHRRVAVLNSLVHGTLETWYKLYKTYSIGNPRGKHAANLSSFQTVHIVCVTRDLPKPPVLPGRRVSDDLHHLGEHDVAVLGVDLLADGGGRAAEPRDVGEVAHGDGGVGAAQQPLALQPRHRARRRHALEPRGGVQRGRAEVQQVVGQRPALPPALTAGQQRVTQTINELFCIVMV